MQIMNTFLKRIFTVFLACVNPASSVAKPYSETGHLYPENRLLPRPVWFKGSKDRGLRGNLAA